MKILGDRKRGGELGFEEQRDRNTTNNYGLEINAKRYEAWGKVGYVFPGKPYKSFGFQLSATRHEHDSYFGFNNHDVDQNSFYGNFIYQSIFSNTTHKFKTGVSVTHDEYDEQFNDAGFDRLETVPGAFFEYTYDDTEKLTVIAGIRADYNTLFDNLFFTPRLHLRYNVTPSTVVRASIGEGRRTANIIAENTGILASSRQISFQNTTSDKGYGFRQDKALNFGINLSQEFRYDYRNGILNIDFYHTRFDDQVVLDLDQNPHQAIFLGLDGTSYSNSLQAQVDYELVKRVDLRVAYRWLDVQVDYTQGQLQKPLVARNRAFLNLAYENRTDWSFDYTLLWTGEQRVPNTSTNPESFQRSGRSEDFITMNAQVTKSFKKGWDVYLGMENINNYTQDDPIISAGDPFSPYFDSSLVWAPIFGRMIYAGFRYKID
ncbi:MAG: TonB-dependent receptor [Bacteroidota bacterium]